MPKFLDVRDEPTYGIGICGRCSRKFPLRMLMPDPNSPGLMVCEDDRDVLDPYRLPPRTPDPLTLPFYRPDTPMTFDTAIYPVIADQTVLGNDQTITADPTEVPFTALSAGMLADSFSLITRGTTFELLSSVQAVAVYKTTASPTSITLSANPYNGQRVLIVDAMGDASTNNITIYGPMNGGTFMTISSDFGWVRLRYTGTEWTIAG